MIVQGGAQIVQAAPQGQRGQTHQLLRAKQVREYSRVWGQPHNVVASWPGGLAGDETTYREGGRSRPHQDLCIYGLRILVLLLHQNVMGKWPKGGGTHPLEWNGQEAQLGGICPRAGGLDY